MYCQCIVSSEFCTFCSSLSVHYCELMYISEINWRLMLFPQRSYTEEQRFLLWSNR